MTELILLRHGQSTWNLQNRFTGWYDCPLSPAGELEAAMAGRRMRDLGIFPDAAHTSLLQRATATCDLALAELGLSAIPIRRSWRLNERHYGDLTGLDKAQTAQHFGTEQVQLWRRSYDVAPPPIQDDNPWNPADSTACADLEPASVPNTESLADVLQRLLPYWKTDLAADLRAFGCVLVTAHGNSLRALIKHLDGVADEAIAEIEVPTGVPIRYELTAELKPRHDVELESRFVTAAGP